MRFVVAVVLVCLVGSVSSARAERADELEAWLRQERIVSFLANRQVVVVERVGAILVCVRAHAGEPVCVIERDRAVHDVLVTFDSRDEAGAFHYCVSWAEADGVRRWARWDRRSPGTRGACVEDYDVEGLARREHGRSGLFATRTTERVPLYASLDHRAFPRPAQGMRVVEDDEAVCFAAPAGWTCTPRLALHHALTSDRIESLTSVSARYLVHAVEAHSHSMHHTLALLSFEGGEVRVLDTLALGWVLMRSLDAGPPYAWRLEGLALVVEPRTEDGAPPSTGILAGRYRLDGGRFERAP